MACLVSSELHFPKTVLHYCHTDISKITTNVKAFLPIITILFLKELVLSLVCLGCAPVVPWCHWLQLWIASSKLNEVGRQSWISQHAGSCSALPCAAKGGGVWNNDWVAVSDGPGKCQCIKRASKEKGNLLLMMCWAMSPHLSTGWQICSQWHRHRFCAYYWDKIIL